MRDVTQTNGRVEGETGIVSAVGVIATAVGAHNDVDPNLVAAGAALAMGLMGGFLSFFRRKLS